MSSCARRSAATNAKSTEVDGTMLTSRGEVKEVVIEAGSPRVKKSGRNDVEVGESRNVEAGGFMLKTTRVKKRWKTKH